MTPAEVATLLEQHGLAPHWRKPVKPAPIILVREDSRVTMLRGLYVDRTPDPDRGAYWRSRQWT
jgi:hypothetical protein